MRSFKMTDFCPAYPLGIESIFEIEDRLLEAVRLLYHQGPADYPERFLNEIAPLSMALELRRLRLKETPEERHAVCDLVNKLHRASGWDEHSHKEIAATLLDGDPVPARLIPEPHTGSLLKRHLRKILRKLYELSE